VGTEDENLEIGSRLLRLGKETTEVKNGPFSSFPSQKGVLCVPETIVQEKKVMSWNDCCQTAQPLAHSFDQCQMKDVEFERVRQLVPLSL